MYTRAELTAITPNVLRRYFEIVAYGQPNPAAILPAKVRHTYIEMQKKAISFFMPAKDQQWRHGIGGNPTKSQAINALIAEMKRQEVRQRGVPSRAVRPVTVAEFEKQLEILWSAPDL
jgi:hypothetical protein